MSVNKSTRKNGWLTGRLDITPEIISEAAEMYRTGSHMREIAAKFGGTVNGIYKAMRRTGVVFDRYCTRLTKEERCRVSELYAEGLSQLAVAQVMGCGHAKIANHLQKTGVRIRTRGESGRKYTLDQSAFDVVTEESAYWVGFLMADGCIYIPNDYSQQIVLRLSSKDESHLEKYRAFLKSDKPLTHGKPYITKKCETRHLTCLHVSSAKLVTRLAEFGVSPRKSFTAKVIGLENDRHFWRGVIDGDGCVRWGRSPAGWRATLTLCGSEELLQQFRTYCSGIIPECKAKVHRRENIWGYKLDCHKATAVIRHLYDKCSIALDRKNKIAQEIIRENGARPREG